MNTEEELRATISKLESTVYQAEKQIRRQRNIESRLENMENWLRSQFTSFANLKPAIQPRSNASNAVRACSSRTSFATLSPVRRMSLTADNNDHHQGSESGSDIDDHDSISDNDSYSNDAHDEDFPRTSNSGRHQVSHERSDRLRMEKDEYRWERRFHEKTKEHKLGKVKSRRRSSPAARSENNSTKKVISINPKVESNMKEPQSTRKSVSRPTGRCQFGCQKTALKTCEICNKFICLDHRFKAIRCPNYVPALKDCYSDENQVKKCNWSKDGVGRCVCCTGGKSRKTSRTKCQTCGRFICAEHQIKSIRCPEHKNSAKATNTSNADIENTERPLLPFPIHNDLNSYEGDAIDRIMMI